MDDSTSLKGKVALVTGAAHPKGMGAAACLRLSELGATVIATDIDRGSNRESLEQLSSELGGLSRTAILDVTNPASVKEVVSSIDQIEGRLDILFNNAGLGQGVGPFLDIDDAVWEAVWQVNVKGIVNCCRAAIPLMISGGGGAIINNASLAGLGVVAEMSGYSTTKFAVVGLTKSLAAEFGEHGIRCNAVCPGSIKTAMYELEIAHQMSRTNATRAETEAEFDALVPLGYSAEAREVANAVAYLAGPGSGYITGVALPVAGGMAPGL